MSLIANETWKWYSYRVLSPSSALKNHDFWKSLWSDSLLSPLLYYSNVSREIQDQQCTAGSAQSQWCRWPDVPLLRSTAKYLACPCGQGLQKADIRKQNRKPVLKFLVWQWDSPAPTAFLGSRLWLHLSFTAVCWFSCLFKQDALIQIITALQSKWEANHWPLCRRTNPLGDTAVLQQWLSWSSLMPYGLEWERQGTTEWNAAPPFLNAAHLSRHKLGCLGQTHCLFAPASSGDSTLKAIPWAGWNGLSHTLTHRRRESNNITSSQQYGFPHMPSSLVTEPTYSPGFDLTDSSAGINLGDLSNNTLAAQIQKQLNLLNFEFVQVRTFLEICRVSLVPLWNASFLLLMARTSEMWCICRTDLWEISIPPVRWLLGAVLRQQVLACAMWKLYQGKYWHRLISHISRWPKYNFWVPQGFVPLMVLMNGLKGNFRQQMWQ